VQRKSGCGSGVLAIALLFAFVLGMDLVAKRIDRWRFPWGYPGSGKQTLAGTWVGPVTTGSGQRLAMFMDLELAPLDRGRRRTPIIRTRRNRWLEGRIFVCGNSGRVQHFTLWGAPDDTKAASQFHLSLSPSDSVPPDGLAPSHIKGRWSGGDSVDLMTSLYLRRGKSAISSSDDPDTGRDTPATLKRGTEAEFDSLCNGARGAAGRG
jgi:hypothetical protein